MFAKYTIKFVIVISICGNANGNNKFRVALEKAFSSSNQGKRPVKRAPTPNHPRDGSSNPDVIFLVQRPGMSTDDFKELKSFISTSIDYLPNVLSDPLASRVGVTFYTALAFHPINFVTCCSSGKSNLKYTVMIQTFSTVIINRTLNQWNHTDLDPDAVDVVYAFRSIREVYLLDETRSSKPTLVVFVANFNALSASYRKMADAVEEIDLCKDAGAWVLTIIVDPMKNRQPRIKSDVEKFIRFSNNRKRRRKRQSLNGLTRTQKNSAELRRFILSRPDPDVVKNPNYHEELEQKVKSSQEKYVKSVVRAQPNRIERARKYNNLTLLYARELSSLPEYGFKINYYHELNTPPISNILRRLLSNPSSWFGDGEINSSCSATKHLHDRAIWSPGYFTAYHYPEGTACRWYIRAKPGNFIYLKFDFFNTEATFDPVVIFDGYQGVQQQLLGTFSGFYDVEDVMPRVNSTAEKMLIVFKSDGGSNYAGFHATWTAFAIPDKIEGAEVLFSVDVSASIRGRDLEPVKEWIKTASSFFYFKGEAQKLKEKEKDRKRKNEERNSKESYFGLVTFDSRNLIVSGMNVEKDKETFHRAVDRLNHTQGNTYIGEALDFARLKQFYLVNGEANFIPIAFNDESASPPAKLLSGKTEQCNTQKAWPRVMFLFSDAYSIDDPRQAATRMCDDGILPVLIRIGRVNIRGVDDVTSYCGLSFSIRIPVPEVMLRIKMFSVSLDCSRMKP